MERTVLSNPVSCEMAPPLLRRPFTTACSSFCLLCPPPPPSPNPSTLNLTHPVPPQNLQQDGAVHPAPAVDVWGSSGTLPASEVQEEDPSADCGLPLGGPSGVHMQGQGRVGEGKDHILQLIQEQPGA